MKDLYENFYPHFTAERFNRFVNRMDDTLGFAYRLSTTPFLLTQSRFERLIRITEAVVRLLQSPRYHQQVTRSDWFLPQNAMRPGDYFGDVEFHLSDSEEKIIEVNFNPPGHVGLLELLEESFLQAFDLPVARRPNQGFEKALVEAVTENFHHKSIAISVNHTAASVPYYAHYKYFERIFAQYGIASRVVYAKDVEFDATGYPVWNGERYDRIFNLLIVRVWQDHPDSFARYTEAYRRHPNRFFLNPLGWKLGNKNLLAVCHRLREEAFGLSEADVETITAASLKTHRLTEFASPEAVMAEFGGAQGFVLKPLDNYHVKGVAIQPQPERLNPIFASERDNYIAQAYFPPAQIPCTRENREIQPMLFSLRMGFLNGRFTGTRGYNFTNPATHEELTPVMVVCDE